MIKVKMVPHPSDVAEKPDGISRVVESYDKHLPNFNIKIVGKKATSYDLVAAHAGATGGDCDVCHSHGLYWSGDHTAPDIEFQTNASVIAAMRAAREITVPSHWVAENLARGGRFWPQIVPHGIDWKEWRHKEKHEGYILWNKNRKSAVCDPQPVSMLARNFPGRQFISTFTDNDAPTNIKKIGVVPHNAMKRWVQHAGVYLSTTKETFGIGILEAMAAGVPVLSVGRGGALDIVQHNETGYLASSWEDMNDGLIYCLENRERLGKAAQQIVQGYSWEKVCEIVAQVYERALKPSPPFVTVVIPSFNYEAVVVRAIESVRNQTWDEWECVIVDDGSEDNSQQVISKAIEGDNRFRFIAQGNLGVAHARNNGIAAGKGKYVCCIDADDQIEPTFLEVCINALEQSPTLGIAYTNLRWVRPDGLSQVGAWPTEFDYQKQLQGQNQVPTCCVFKREMWQRLGGYRQRYAPQGAGAEDAEFWLRAGAYGYYAKRVSTEPLFIYSFLTGNVTGNRRYKEVDWLGWHPWVKDSKHPFMSIAQPNKASHPVYQYDEPVVSVVIPVGPGHEGTLTDALDSLEAQTFRKWEAVVVNDTGNSLNLDAYPYVRVFNTEGKTGAGAARNRGVEQIRAKLWVALDADDFLQPDFLKEVITAHQDDNESWIYTDCFILHESGFLEHYRCPSFTEEELFRNGIAAVTCLYTKKMWEETGGFDEANNREDWDFHFKLAMHGHCGHRVIEPLFTYRHGTGTRRVEGDVSQEATRLRKLYPLKELRTVCKGCRKGNTRRSAIVTGASAAPLTQSELSWPLLEYIGRNQNTLTFNGNEHRRYRFGNNEHHRYNRIHPDDVHRLMRFKCFVKTGTAPTANRILTAQAIPQAQPVPPPQPVPVIQTKPTSIWEEVIKDAGELATRPVEDKGNGKPIIDVSTLKVKDLKTIQFTVDEWQQVLEQENAKHKPRKMIVKHAESRIAAGV